MQRADVTEPGTRGRWQRPEEGKEEEAGMGSGDTGRSELCCEKTSTLRNLVAFPYFSQEMTKKVAIPRVAERDGKDEEEALP